MELLLILLGFLALLGAIVLLWLHIASKVVPLLDMANTGYRANRSKYFDR